MRVMSQVLVVLSISVLDASKARAQHVVRGTVSDDAGHAIAAVVVRLERDGAVIARALAGDDGRFALPVSDTGSYVVRGQRIGFQPAAAAARVPQPSGESVSLRFAARVRTLDPVRVVREERCGTAMHTLPDLEMIWTEAVKALEATHLAGRAQNTPLVVTRHVRRLSRDGTTVLADTSLPGSAVHYESIAAESLQTEGYVVSEGSDIVFRAPDVATLMSNQFLETHCFSLEGATPRRREIGIRFRPTRDVRTPDIEGVMWVDPATYELREIEFTYTRLREWARHNRSGGFVRFARMPSGRWFVSAWTIRMPMSATTRRVEMPAGNEIIETRLLGFREEGATVLVRTP